MIEIGNQAEYPCSVGVNAGNTEAECLGPVTNEETAKEVAQNTGSGRAKVNWRGLFPCASSSESIHLALPPLIQTIALM